MLIKIRDGKHMKYEVIQEIKKTTNNGVLIIPKGTILYKLPSDHMGNVRDYDYFSWNGQIVEIERDSNSLKQI